jgi:hypothetical protein
MSDKPDATTCTWQHTTLTTEDIDAPGGIRTHKQASGRRQIHSVHTVHSLYGSKKRNGKKAYYRGVTWNRLLMRFWVPVIYYVSDRVIRKNLFLLIPLHCYALKQFVLDLYRSFKTTRYRNPPVYNIILIKPDERTSSATSSLPFALQRSCKF